MKCQHNLVTTIAIDHNLQWPYDAPALAIRCREGNDVDVIVRWKKTIKLADHRPYFIGKIRWDAGPAVSSRWKESANNEATFYMDVPEFLQLAQAHSQVTVRIPDRSGENYDAIFETAELEAALDPYTDICGQ